MDMAKTAIHEAMTEEARPSSEEAKPEEPVEKALMQIPSSLYLLATGASILASLGLFLKKNKEAALFVGLWAPTILGLGLLRKLMQTRKES